MPEDRGDALLHERPRPGDIPAAVRQPAHDQHQTLRRKLRRLLDGAAVLLEGGGEPRAAACGEKTAAAQPGPGQAGVADPELRLLESERRNLVAPGRDAADAVPLAAGDDLVELPLRPHGGGVERQQRGIGAHQASMPCVASNARMRRAARSGSRSKPALSASRNNSDRCRIWRALCWPPTIAK